MLISRRGYNQNDQNVLSPGWWTYDWVGLLEGWVIITDTSHCNCTLKRGVLHVGFLP